MTRDHFRTDNTEGYTTDDLAFQTNYREVLMHLAPMTKQRFGLVDENDDVVGRHDTYEAAADAAYLSQGQHSVALLNPDGSVNANEDPEGFKSDLSRLALDAA